MAPEFNLPSFYDVQALLQSIRDDETRQILKKMIEMMMANQEKTDKRIMELTDLCKELDQRLREQEQNSSKKSIIFNNLPDNPRDGELMEL